MSRNIFSQSILLLGVALLLQGCATNQPGRSFQAPQVYQWSVTSESTFFAVERQKKLQMQYSKWQGTPYVYGGNSDKGIDCSAFMMRVFEASFNASIPRTTIQQVKVGQQVAKGRLQIGDLVFFKTGWNKRHVGVFIGKSQFMHASVSKGVTISKLDDPYWSSRYWQSRRILKDA